MPVSIGQLRTLEVESTNAYLKGLQAITPPLFKRIAQEIKMNTKTVEAPIVGMVGPLREWVGPRLIERLARDAYSITAKKYEKTVAVPRESVEDDNVGLYLPQIETLGKQVDAWPDQQVFAKLAAGGADKCYDGKNFFSVLHPLDNGFTSGTFANVTASGGSPTWYLFDTTKGIMPLIWALRSAPEFATLWDTKDPNVFYNDEYVSGVRARGVADYGFPHFAYAIRNGLTASTFESALTAMGSITNAKGESMGIRPNLAIVPVALEADAKRLWGSELAIVGTSGIAGAITNVNFRAIDFLVAPRLPNAADSLGTIST